MVILLRPQMCFFALMFNQPQRVFDTVETHPTLTPQILQVGRCSMVSILTVTDAD